MTNSNEEQDLLSNEHQVSQTAEEELFYYTDRKRFSRSKSWSPTLVRRQHTSELAIQTGDSLEDIGPEQKQNQSNQESNTTQDSDIVRESRDILFSLENVRSMPLMERLDSEDSESVHSESSALVGQALAAIRKGMSGVFREQKDDDGKQLEKIDNSEDIASSEDGKHTVNDNEINQESTEQGTETSPQSVSPIGIQAVAFPVEVTKDYNTSGSFDVSLEAQRHRYYNDSGMSTELSYNEFVNNVKGANLPPESEMYLNRLERDLLQDDQDYRNSRHSQRFRRNIPHDHLSTLQSYNRDNSNNSSFNTSIHRTIETQTYPISRVIETQTDDIALSYRTPVSRSLFSDHSLNSTTRDTGVNASPPETPRRVIVASPWREMNESWDTSGIRKLSSNSSSDDERDYRKYKKQKEKRRKSRLSQSGSASANVSSTKADRSSIEEINDDMTQKKQHFLNCLKSWDQAKLTKKKEVLVKKVNALLDALMQDSSSETTSPAEFQDNLLQTSDSPLPEELSHAVCALISDQVIARQKEQFLIEPRTSSPVSLSYTRQLECSSLPSVVCEVPCRGELPEDTIVSDVKKPNLIIDTDNLQFSKVQYEHINPEELSDPKHPVVELKSLEQEITEIKQNDTEADKSNSSINESLYSYSKTDDNAKKDETCSENEICNNSDREEINASDISKETNIFCKPTENNNTNPTEDQSENQSVEESLKLGERSINLDGTEQVILEEAMKLKDDNVKLDSSTESLPEENETNDLLPNEISLKPETHIYPENVQESNDFPVEAENLNTNEIIQIKIPDNQSNSAITESLNDPVKLQIEVALDTEENTEEIKQSVDDNDLDLSNENKQFIESEGVIQPYNTNNTSDERSIVPEKHISTKDSENISLQNPLNSGTSKSHEGYDADRTVTSSESRNIPLNEVADCRKISSNLCSDAKEINSETRQCLEDILLDKSISSEGSASVANETESKSSLCEESNESVTFVETNDVVMSEKDKKTILADENTSNVQLGTNSKESDTIELCIDVPELEQHAVDNKSLLEETTEKSCLGPITKITSPSKLDNEMIIKPIDSHIQCENIIEDIIENIINVDKSTESVNNSSINDSDTNFDCHENESCSTVQSIENNNISVDLRLQDEFKDDCVTEKKSVSVVEVAAAKAFTKCDGKYKILDLSNDTDMAECINDLKTENDPENEEELTEAEIDQLILNISFETSQTTPVINKPPNYDTLFENKQTEISEDGVQTCIMDSVNAVEICQENTIPRDYLQTVTVEDKDINLSNQSDNNQVTSSPKNSLNGEERTVVNEETSNSNNHSQNHNDNIEIIMGNNKDDDKLSMASDLDINISGCQLSTDHSTVLSSTPINVLSISPTTYLNEKNSPVVDVIETQCDMASSKEDKQEQSIIGNKDNIKDLTSSSSSSAFKRISRENSFIPLSEDKPKLSEDTIELLKPDSTHLKTTEEITKTIAAESSTCTQTDFALPDENSVETNPSSSPLTDELDWLRKEKIRIMGMLAKDEIPSKLQVKLLYYVFTFI